MEGSIKDIGKKRDSNIELYRIIVMIAIVAHHYVVNSGLFECISASNSLSTNSLFLLLFGCWGKVGINCFVLITGYFMCKSNITLKKFLKLVLEWLFYKYVILVVFIFLGYQEMSIKALLISVIPIRLLTTGFTSCYVVFFLFIPFLNILVQNMNMKQHQLLLLLSIGVFSVLASIPFFRVESNYVIWFIVLYFVSSYIRLYPINLFSNTKFWGWMSVAAISLAYFSVFLMVWIKQRFGYTNYYFFLSDSYKTSALAVAICLFMFFKNVRIKYNPFINRVAASTFGVLCIHAASDEMRQWLWYDTCKNINYFDSSYLYVHAIVVVLAVFTICTLIDQLRILLLEKPFFRFFDNKITPKISKKSSVN